MSKVLDVDVAMENIMNAWFEQRHENRRQLAKTIETHRVIASGDQRLDFARLVHSNEGTVIKPPQDTTIHGWVSVCEARCTCLNLKPYDQSKTFGYFEE